MVGPLFLLFITTGGIKALQPTRIKLLTKPALPAVTLTSLVMDAVNFPPKPSQDNLLATLYYSRVGCSMATNVATLLIAYKLWSVNIHRGANYRFLFLKIGTTEKSSVISVWESGGPRRRMCWLSL